MRGEESRFQQAIFPGIPRHMYDFPSNEWAQAYKDAINANPEYKVHGKDWTHGVVAFVVKADPALHIDHDTALWLDVHGGECREVKLMTAEEAQAAAFVIVLRGAVLIEQGAAPISAQAPIVIEVDAATRITVKSEARTVDIPPLAEGPESERAGEASDARAV